MTTSPNNTIITAANQVITDAKGNQWSIDAAGQIVVNGVVDTTTSNVQILAYENGKVWQMNTSDLWWSKSSPEAKWKPPYGTKTSPLVNVASINDDVFTYVGPVITDRDDNNWSITSSGQVAVNGVPDPTTANVDELAYYNGVVWQKNAANQWYSKTSAASPWVQWTKARPPVPIPDASINDARVFASVPGILIDANGNQWSIDSGQVTVDGTIDPTTANVVELAIVKGAIWQENAAGLWYTKSSPASAWSAGTPTSPLVTPKGLPSSLIWTGSTGNLASNPASWSPATAPAPGDALTMSSGTINIVGNALAGDTLTIAQGATSGRELTDTINTSDAAALNLYSAGGNYLFSLTLSLNVAAGSTLLLNADLDAANLTAAGGGTIAFTGSNILAGSAVFNDNLTGTATIDLPSSVHVPASVVINGSVGSGLTFLMNSGASVSDLTLNAPARFAGTIELGVSPASLGHVTFSGIQATSAELLNGVLDMFNGTKLVDATRFSNPQGLGVTLYQDTNGVVLTAGSSSDGNPFGPLIPLKT